MEKLYYDTEANELVTETQLRNEFAMLQATVPEDYLELTFEQFKANCYTRNGGTLVDYEKGV